MTKSLFDPINEKRCPEFEVLRTRPESEPARRELDRVFLSMPDADGNLVEQFQTTGFDSRLFELYLTACFAECGFRITRPPSPDFVLEKEGLCFSVEATTTNPSKGGVLKEHGQKIPGLAPPERLQYLQNEFPMRVGGALFNKVRERYWERSNVKGSPFVLAIGAFHGQESQSFGHTSLLPFLYGKVMTEPHFVDGELKCLELEAPPLTVGTKTVPCGFFEQEELENVSAIMFTNSGTLPKFTRMGVANAPEAGSSVVFREGLVLNPLPEALDPSSFFYDCRAPLWTESWVDGLVIMHNPNAKLPLPPRAVEGAAEIAWGPSGYTENMPPHFVFKSKTVSGLAVVPPLDPLLISVISSQEGERLARLKTAPGKEVVAWFSDTARSVLGAIFWHDDQFWCAGTLKKHEGSFARPGRNSPPFPLRPMAVEWLQRALAIEVSA